MKVIKCKVCGQEHMCTRMSNTERAKLAAETRHRKVPRLKPEEQKDGGPK